MIVNVVDESEVVSLITQLCDERRRRGLTIAALAARIGVSPVVLASYERFVTGRNGRRPPTWRLAQWAGALELRLALIPAGDSLDWTAARRALLDAAAAEIARVKALSDELTAAARLAGVIGRPEDSRRLYDALNGLQLRADAVAAA